MRSGLWCDCGHVLVLHAFPVFGLPNPEAKGQCLAQHCGCPSFGRPFAEMLEEIAKDAAPPQEQA